MKRSDAIKIIEDVVNRWIEESEEERDTFRSPQIRSNIDKRNAEIREAFKVLKKGKK